MTDKSLTDTERREAWLVAQAKIGRCERCKEWERLGLSDTCPSCEAAVLTRYNQLCEAVA